MAGSCDYSAEIEQEEAVAAWNNGILVHPAVIVGVLLTMAAILISIIWVKGADP